MGKLFDNRVVDRASLLSFTINFSPIGYDSPTVWMVQGSASFVCYDSSGISLGIIQSNNSSFARVPYYIILRGLTAKPTAQQIADSFFQNEPNFLLWVAQQIFNLSGQVSTGYKLDTDGVTVLKS
jgi:hypothetical protein